MNKILLKITNIIERYDGGEWQSSDNLRLMLRELSSNYYFLTKYNIEFAQQYNMHIYNFKGSDAAGRRFAELKCPELRQTRKILQATDRVLNSIRSEISTINKDK